MPSENILIAVTSIPYSEPNEAVKAKIGPRALEDFVARNRTRTFWMRARADGLLEIKGEDLQKVQAIAEKEPSGFFLTIVKENT